MELEKWIRMLCFSLGLKQTEQKSVKTAAEILNGKMNFNLTF